MLLALHYVILYDVHVPYGDLLPQEKSRTRVGHMVFEELLLAFP